MHTNPILRVDAFWSASPGSCFETTMPGLYYEFFQIAWVKDKKRNGPQKVVTGTLSDFSQSLVVVQLFETDSPSLSNILLIRAGVYRIYRFFLDRCLYAAKEENHSALMVLIAHN